MCKNWQAQAYHDHTQVHTAPLPGSEAIVGAHPYCIEVNSSQCCWECIAKNPREGSWPRHSFITGKFKQAVIYRNGHGASARVEGPSIHLSKFEGRQRPDCAFIRVIASPKAREYLNCIQGRAEGPSIPSLWTAQGEISTSCKAQKFRRRCHARDGCWNRASARAKGPNVL